MSSDRNESAVSNCNESEVLSTIGTSGLQQLLAISTSLTTEENKADLQPVDEEVAFLYFSFCLVFI